MTFSRKNLKYKNGLIHFRTEDEFIMKKKIFAAFLLGIISIACSGTPSSETAKTETTTPARPAAPALATPNPAITDPEVAVIETDYGKIKIKFFPDVAPQHVENFKKLAREQFYNGLAFHRVIPDNIIQGGDPNTRSGDPSEWGMGQPGQPNVNAEFNTRPFVKGTVGMARRGGDVNSATSQFFICLTEHPEWNGKYTVFGEVVQGIETVKLISNAPSDPTSQKVKDKVVMKKVFIEKAGN